MPTDVIKPNKSDGSSSSKRIAAAEYLRMSTEHQDYSLSNQSAAIREFALKEGFSVIRTYTDGGRSGLNISARPGLKALIRDIESGKIPRTAIDKSLARIFKVKQRLQVPADARQNFENILEENKSLAQEMQTFYKE